MIGACANPMPMMRSKLRSANARIAGSMLTRRAGLDVAQHDAQAGLSAVCAVRPLPVSAHFTPFHAAALNDRSSLPPMSNTMPASVVDGSLTA